MKKVYRFYKYGIFENWYVDLPEWKGSLGDLQMVLGADTMLDILSNNGNEVWLEFSTKRFIGSSCLRLMGKDPRTDEGMVYNLKTYKGRKLNLDMWLCDVTKFVFGDFPEKIYIKTYKPSWYKKLTNFIKKLWK